MAKVTFVPAGFTIGEKAPKESARVHFTVIRNEAEQRKVTRDLGLYTEFKSRKRR
jgi:hypothetical protein